MNPIRYALRSLLKSPGYSIVALLTLALGIGVNTSMFSLVDTLLLKAAPFPEGDRLYQVIGDTRQGPHYQYAEAETREISDKSTSFGALTTLRFMNSALAEPGRPAEQVQAVMASAEFFDTFGVQPFLGRAFTRAETEPGRNQVIVLSHAFWQQHFAGNREIVGHAVRIDGEVVTVIGVMPASFDWHTLWGTTSFWRPLNFTPDQLRDRQYRTFNLIGRLKPEASPEQAAAELGAVAAQQLKDFPQDYNGLSYRTVVLHEAQMDDQSRRILWMLLGLSAFVLLIACANIANLQLARATIAMREFAIRAALGASRARLIRQQLTECVLLSLAGGVVGVIVALWLNQALSAMITFAGQPGWLNLTVDGRILLATFTVAAVTGVIFGIFPAWLSSRTDVVSALKAQSRGATTGRGQHRMRQVLIVSEVTLALILLGGAGVMQRGFAKLLHRDVGWETTRLLTGTLPMPEARFPTPESRLEFFRKIETRLGALPGVEKVALTTSVPIWAYGTERKIFTAGQTGADQAGLPLASHVMITSDFFAAMGIPFVEGHGFAANLKPGDPRVSVINESLARRLWPNQSALGQRLASINGAETTWSEVIGVVRDTESAVGLSNGRVADQVFRPVAHEPWTWIQFVIRAQAPGSLIESVRRAIAEVDPDLPADQLMTVPTAVDLTQHNFVVVARLLDGFAALGLVLAAIGLYGVISNLVAQRTSEFGIRLALGAKPSDVLNLVLRHGLKLTLIGLIIGMGGAYGLSVLLNTIMPRLVSPDPVTLGGMAAILFFIAAFACWLPARRATQVDPLVALRNE